MNRIKTLTSLAALLASCAGDPAHAGVPEGRPFAMRGVEPGITLSEFRRIAAPNDDGASDVRTWCSGDPGPGGKKVIVPAEDAADGIVECKWYSVSALTPMFGHDDHWVAIGTGRGTPTFHFIPVAGEPRLFRISFYANIKYYPGILDALTRGYGAADTKVAPFQTMSGAHFTSATSLWRNPLSSIRLEQRCGHLERYCLTYDHTIYAGLYGALQEKRAAAAASKI